MGEDGSNLDIFDDDDSGSSGLVIPLRPFHEDGDYMSADTSPEAVEAALKNRPTPKVGKDLFVSKLTDKLMSAKDLGRIPPPRPILGGLLYRSTLAQLAAESGSYKSFLTVAWACHVATGLDMGDHTVRERQKVIYIAAEGVESLLVRILAWCEHHKVDPSDLDGWLEVLPEPIQLDDPESVSDTQDMVSAIRPALVIMDTRAKVTVGMDENSATEQGRAIAVADDLIRATGCTVLVVHHTSRGGNGAGRGSNAWDGGVWSDLRATARRNELQVAVTCAKHKGAKSQCTHTFDLKSHYVASDLMPTDGMDDVEAEDLRRTLVAVASDGLVAPVPKESPADLILSALAEPIARDGLSATDLMTATGLARSSVYRELNDLIGSGKVTKNKTRYALSTPA